MIIEIVYYAHDDIYYLFIKNIKKKHEKEIIN
jgi:hypothetical protein